MSNDRVPTGRTADPQPGTAAVRAAAAAHDGTSHAPPPRVRAWDEPVRQEPILDASRVPLSTLMARRQPVAAVASWIWLRVLRPLLVIMFWLAIAAYAYRHFFGPIEETDDYTLLAYYGLLVVCIFAAMLLLAPLRRKADRVSEVGPHPRRDTGKAVAVYTDVSAEHLSTLQDAKRVVVEHDDNARMRAGADLDTGPKQPGPAVEPKPRDVPMFDRRANIR